jgi:antitoxin VapB
MGLSIKDPETERLVRALAAQRGTGVTGAVRLAVEKELGASRSDGDDEWWSAIQAIQARSCALPVLDERDADDIVGYDDNGAPA